MSPESVQRFRDKDMRKSKNRRPSEYRTAECVQPSSLKSPVSTLQQLAGVGSVRLLQAGGKLQRVEEVTGEDQTLPRRVVWKLG
jgi:hypothetical protein